MNALRNDEYQRARQLRAITLVRLLSDAYWWLDGLADDLLAAMVVPRD